MASDTIEKPKLKDDVLVVRNLILIFLSRNSSETLFLMHLPALQNVFSRIKFRVSEPRSSNGKRSWKIRATHEHVAGMVDEDILELSQQANLVSFTFKDYVGAQIKFQWKDLNCVSVKLLLRNRPCHYDRKTELIYY